MFLVLLPVEVWHFVRVYKAYWFLLSHPHLPCSIFSRSCDCHKKSATKWNREAVQMYVFIEDRTMAPNRRWCGPLSEHSLDLVSQPVHKVCVQQAGMESHLVCNSTGGYALPTLANLGWGYATVREYLVVHQCTPRAAQLVKNMLCSHLISSSNAPLG